MFSLPFCAFKGDRSLQYNRAYDGDCCQQNPYAITYQVSVQVRRNAFRRAFPWPSTAVRILDLPLPFDCLSLTFYCLLAAFLLTTQRLCEQNLRLPAAKAAAICQPDWMALMQVAYQPCLCRLFHAAHMRHSCGSMALCS